MGQRVMGQRSNRGNWMRGGKQQGRRGCLRTAAIVGAAGVQSRGGNERRDHRGTYTCDGKWLGPGVVEEAAANNRAAGVVGGAVAHNETAGVVEGQQLRTTSPW